MKPEDLLAKFNLTFEDLKGDEVNVYLNWLKSIEKQEITVDKVKDYLRQLIMAVQRELVDTPEFTPVFFGLLKTPNRQQIMLKARLKNYLFIDIYLNSPTKAKQMLETQLESIADEKKQQTNG